jgi:hypothetical protein
LNEKADPGYKYYMNAVSPERNYAIDWLRVFAMFMVFLFHCARFFDKQDWHVKNPQPDTIIRFIVLFLAQWIMPLFFILSGISSYYSLAFRKADTYIRGRFKRLMIPLIFGIFVLIPPQVYFERVSHFQFKGSFIQFFPHYFDGFYAFGGNFAWMGLHLWYLLMLFVFSLLTLPFFKFIRREPRSALISRFISFLERKGTLFLLALPLAAVELIFNPATIGRRDFGGWSPFLYIIFFIYGYVVFSNHQLQGMVKKQRNIALASGLITTTTALVILISKGFPEYGTAYFLFMTTIRAFNSWFWLLAVIGFGFHYGNFNNKLLAYSNEAVLPFYILHQTLIVTICFYLISWQINVGIKYSVIASTSMVSILVLYEVFVRRINLMRFLFGLKSKIQ